MNKLLHLHEFSIWLNATGFHNWARAITRSYTFSLPIIQGVHIVAVCAIVGSIGMLSLRMAGLVPGGPLKEMAHRLMPWTWVALLVQITTGVFMIADRPGRAFDSFSFPYKMLMLIVAIALMSWFSLMLRRDPSHWDENGGHRLSGRLLGVLSFLLWVGVIFGGRWIAYERAA